MNTRAPKLWVGITIALLAFAGVAFAATGRERSLAVYPAQQMPLHFDHSVHMKADMECVACHDSARKSQQTADNNLPGQSKDPHAECSDCHDIDAYKKGKRIPKGDPPASCETCHPGFDFTVQKTPPPKPEMPAANLLFSHKAHIDLKIECKSCHGSMTETILATRQQLPKMETCLQCHDGHYASEDCTTCHLKAPSGRLQLTFASGVLRPAQGNPLGMDHGPRYEFNHGTRASVSRQECLACHEEKYCETCHDSLQKPLPVHPNDFLTLHPLQARIDQTQCEGCHRYQSFCAACHERAGVGMSADPMFRAGNVRVHPSYDIWVTKLGPEHHGVAAARNLQQCISCHREESCLTCHAAGTVTGASRMVNPHPTGFALGCKTMFAKNSVACLKCHPPGVESRCK